MAITISGENNNDRILAADGVIDQISGINIVGLITASHINVGSNIQLGNAGIITATTFTGNLTGNVNSTSPLLLQTGGSERFRITGNNELGIAGANYGSSGQVLTSGGSGSAVTWSAIPTQITFSNPSNDRILTSEGGIGVNAEANLTFANSGSDPVLTITNSGNPQLRLRTTSTTDACTIDFGDADSISRGRIAYVNNGDNMLFYTNGSSGGEKIKLYSDGRLNLSSQQSIGSGTFLHVEAPSSVESGETNVMFEGNATMGARLSLKNNNTSATANNQINFCDAGGQSTSSIIGYNTDQNNNYGELVFGTRNQSGVPPEERLRITSSGAVMINTTNSSSRTLNLKGTFGILSASQTGVLDMSVTDAGAASIGPYVAGGSTLILKTNASGSGVAERLRITSTGELLVGTPNKINTSPSKFQVASNDATGSAILARFNASVYSSYLDFYKSRSNTLGTAYVVNDDDHLGAIRYYAADGSNSGYTTAAEIYGSCDGGSGASGDMPGRITFHTRPDGAGQSMRERLRIDSSGRVMIGSGAYIGGAALAVIGSSTTPNTYGCFAIGRSGANVTNNDTIANIRLNGGTVGTGRGAEINAAADANWSDGSSHPTRLTFHTVASSSTSATERLRINRYGGFGLAGANFGTARETIVSGGASAAVSWSANPFVLDMVGLGDLDAGKLFVRYREVNVTGNGLVYLELCKSTTNCSPGRSGYPIGFVPGVVYNSQFRVDKVGITPWPNSSGHRYEYFAIISDFVATGKLGIFYLTNTTS